MKKIVILVTIAAIAFVTTGCVTPLGAPNYGGLVTSNVKGPVAGVDNNVGMSKRGEAEAQGIIFIAALIDASPVAKKMRTTVEFGGTPRG